MAHDIRYRPGARADLLEIWNYIANDSERAAEKVLARIDSVFHLISTQPAIGRERPELKKGLRSLPAGTYVVFYVVHKTSIDIVRVTSGYRDINEEMILS